MPPQLPGSQALRGLTLCLRPAGRPNLQPWIQTAKLSKKEKSDRLKQRQDPYGWAQSQQRKAANVKRQQEIKKLRDDTWGSPVHGIPTPFVESFDSGGQAGLSTPAVDLDGNPVEKPHELPTSPHILNHLLSQDELSRALSQLYAVTKPLPAENHSTADPVREENALRQHEERHAKAVKVLQRLTNLNNGDAKDRKHANTRRCIETFGRHITDVTLPNATRPPAAGQEIAPQPVRAGPDTGSSEVQIAILTTKIRALASKLEGYKGYKDKNNKRSLRLLCHKRQRLLRYMERKERGSGRWHNMLETLGLSPATWKQQITL
ncbi:hypothetical protein GQ53DRAFT_731858 [Thozetella sp. PMI_491]|nr:hypothetical protein GQ53DRAFT_731858 [Thozetella sp. PMI_491]